jgi:hypothetical protein
MAFSELLIQAIKQSEIPLRFEPGAEESVAQPVTEMIKLWVTAHAPDRIHTDFGRGQAALIAQLLGELEDGTELPKKNVPADQ